MNENILIQTKRSALKIFTINNKSNTNEVFISNYKMFKDIVDECVKEIISQELLNENPKIYIYGRECTQHRSIAFFSDESIGYHYSNQLAESKKITYSLKKLLDFINNNFAGDDKYNGILVNRYKDGTDYIGAHSDNENGLSKSSGVISVSYGATRKFRIRDIHTKKIVKDIPTEEYSIMQMCGDFQKEFTHEVPIEKKIKEERISFTFRKHSV